MKRLLWILFFLTLVYVPHLWAAQDAMIVTDGAMIYKKADFDSTVIGYMRAGQKAKISSKTFGAFYRIQFKQGVVGYVSDVDIEPQGGRKNKHSLAVPDQKTNRSFITKKFFGLIIGQAHFSEIYNNSGKDTEVGTDLLLYGIKYTQPMKFLSGPFVFDAELFYHSGAPSYYNNNISTAKSGRIIVADAEVFYSLFESRKRGFWAYVGGGPALSYTSFMVQYGNSQNDLTEIQFGGVFTGGLGLKVSKMALKFEPKYFAFKSGYFGFFGSAQLEF